MAPLQEVVLDAIKIFPHPEERAGFGARLEGRIVRPATLPIVSS
jgi:hypothetical protein